MKLMVYSFFTLGAVPLLLNYSFAETPNNPDAMPSVTVRPGSRSVPLNVLYRHFFAHMMQLDSKADQLDKAGEVGMSFRKYYQKRLGFTDGQFSKVREAAAGTEAQVEQIDSQARDLIMQFRKELAVAPSGGSALPAPPAELKELQIRRDNLVAPEVRQLKKLLGPEASSRLDDAVVSAFGRGVKIQSLNSLRKSSRPDLTLPSFDQVPVIATESSAPAQIK